MKTKTQVAKIEAVHLVLSDALAVFLTKELPEVIFSTPIFSKICRKIKDFVAKQYYHSKVSLAQLAIIFFVPAVSKATCGLCLGGV